MVGPIAFDTPDYQRGIVSAQKLLATVAGGTANVVTGIPPNAETIIVTLSADEPSPTCGCQGVTTGVNYVGVQLVSQSTVFSTQSWFFDVSDVMDDQVNIGFLNAPAADWFVYADSGVHITADASKLANQIGQAYVIPSVPSILANDHPPNELALAAAFGTAGVAMTADPAAGERIRVYSMSVSSNAAAQTVAITQGNAGTNMLVASGIATTSITLPGQGYPLPASTPLWLLISSGASTAYGEAWYTVETI